jgi:hypothetical protein
MPLTRSLVIAVALLFGPILIALGVLSALLLKWGIAAVVIAFIGLFSVAAGLDGWRITQAMARTRPQRERVRRQKEADRQAAATLHDRYGRDEDREAERRR